MNNGCERDLFVGRSCTSSPLTSRSEGSTTDLTSRSLRCSNARRGMLVMPAEVEWIIKRGASDPTSGSLRKAELEGHACHARGSGMDNQTLRNGRDKRVPPRCSGPDERVPPILLIASPANLAHTQWFVILDNGVLCRTLPNWYHFIEIIH